MGITRKLTTLVGVVASLAAAGPAGAQTFNYFTTGQFSNTLGYTASCNDATPLSSVSCQTPSGFGLTFNGNPVSPFGYQNASQIVYGTFVPTGTGTGTVTPGQVYFSLFINQTNPTTGQTSVIGSFGGTLTQGSGGSFSSLYWKPTKNQVSVGAVTYKLESSQGVPLDSLTIGAQYATAINGHGYISTVPEPSSMALLGTGLFGLVPMIRRRK